MAPLLTRRLLCSGKPVAIFATAISLSLFVTLTLIINSSLREGALQSWTFGKHPTVSTYSEYVEAPPHLTSHFPPPDPERQDYREWNARTMRDLHACILEDKCGTNQQKVALLAAHWFQEAVVGNFRGGEGIWAISVHKHLRVLGYTTLFSTSFDEALAQYRSMPDLVKVVIRNQAGECHANPKCVKGPSNPSGIPAWKIFDFQFFASYGGHHLASLMGGKWILSANPDPRANTSESPIQYIGYSIEDECRKIPVIPLNERHDRVWMLMKVIVYVYNSNFAWNRSYFPLAASELGMDFTGGWKMDQHYGWNPNTKGPMDDIEDQARGVINVGQLGQQDFVRELGQSKILVGMGDPWWSPSPYNALCQGVPFLNPIIKWHKEDPWDRKGWHSQHPSLAPYDPPYVYNVHAHNYTGFLDAIRAASTTEIGRFIPPYMSELAVRGRLTELMETDWKAKAAILLAERQQQPGSYIFDL